MCMLLFIAATVHTKMKNIYMTHLIVAKIDNRLLRSSAHTTLK